MSHERLWLIENDRDFRADEQWGREIASGVVLDRTDNFLEPAYGMKPGNNESGRLVVCINVFSLRHTAPGADFQGLSGADAAFIGELELSLNRWTPNEFRRFLVSGYLPDHAME